MVDGRHPPAPTWGLAALPVDAGLAPWEGLVGQWRQGPRQVRDARSDGVPHQLVVDVVVIVRDEVARGAGLGQRQVGPLRDEALREFALAASPMISSWRSAAARTSQLESNRSRPASTISSRRAAASMLRDMKSLSLSRPLTALWRPPGCRGACL